MAEPSTDDIRALCCSSEADVRAFDRWLAETILAARPAVDVEGIARVLNEALDHPVGFSWSDDPVRYRQRQVAHLAQAVVAYLAGEGR